MRIVERTGRKRPWLAALLAIVHPGLGHVYLREWARALLWFGLVLTAASLLIPTELAAEAASIEAVLEMSRELPFEVALALSAIVFVSMVDAFWVARRKNERTRMEATGTRCPNCGREVDIDIDFCHWCTTELDADVDSAEQTE